MSNTGNDRIERLWELLGPGVLLPWSAGSKGGNKKWNHRQLADMNDATYLAKLEKTGNIGVSLGKVSNGLLTIDIDDDRHVEPFLEANPLLRHTLRTAAQWGCNIWLRCTSDSRWKPNHYRRNSSNRSAISLCCRKTSDRS